VAPSTLQGKQRIYRFPSYELQLADAFVRPWANSDLWKFTGTIGHFTPTNEYQFQPVQAVEKSRSIL